MTRAQYNRIAPDATLFVVFNGGLTILRVRNGINPEPQVPDYNRYLNIHMHLPDGRAEILQRFHRSCIYADLESAITAVEKNRFRHLKAHPRAKIIHIEKFDYVDSVRERMVAQRIRDKVVATMTASLDRSKNKRSVQKTENIEY